MSQEKITKNREENKVTVVLIRHPISIANVKQIAQGNSGGIHRRGYDQIRELQKRFENEKLDRLYSSDSPRCWDLSKALGETTGLEPKYSPIFREIDNGEFSEKNKREIEEFRQKNETRIAPPNGESLDDLYARGEQARIYVRKGDVRRVGLITHGLFLKAFVGMPLGLSPKEILRALKFSNCAMSEVELLEDDRIRINYLNNRDYLKTR